MAGRDGEARVCHVVHPVEQSLVVYLLLIVPARWKVTEALKSKNLLLPISRDEAAVDNVPDDAAPEVAGLSRGGERADERVPHRPLVQPTRPARVLVLERRQQLGEGGELKPDNSSHMFRMHSVWFVCDRP